jgi:hypothetical protein
MQLAYTLQNPGGRSYNLWLSDGWTRSQELHRRREEERRGFERSSTNYLLLWVVLPSSLLL